MRWKNNVAGLLIERIVSNSQHSSPTLLCWEPCMALGEGWRNFIFSLLLNFSFYRHWWPLGISPAPHTKGSSRGIVFPPFPPGKTKISLFNLTPSQRQIHLDKQSRKFPPLTLCFCRCCYWAGETLLKTSFAPDCASNSCFIKLQLLHFKTLVCSFYIRDPGLHCKQYLLEWDLTGALK